MSWRSGDVEVHCWWTDELHIELALGEHRPDLPAGYRIDMGWLGVFRIQASGRRGPMRRWSRSVAIPTLSCSFDGGDSAWTGGGDPGEGLDAQTWMAHDVHVSIGTEDADFMCACAREGSTLPASWEHELCAHFEQPGSADRERYPVQYLDHGLALQLPHLPRGGYCEVHLASSVAHAQSESDIATWWAVDLAPRRSGPAWAR